MMTPSRPTRCSMMLPFLSAFLITYSQGQDKHILMKKDDLLLYQDVKLHPELQHIPLDPLLQDLRPPPPRLLPEEERTIFIGTSAFRDGYRCGTTLFTALSRALHPERVRIGVVDQVLDDDIRCFDSYCERARKHWNASSDDESCPYQENIRIDTKNASNSRGPIVARHFQQQLVQNEEFCLQVDCHSIFTNHWDKFMVEDWADANNEMAVLTTYPHDLHSFVKDNGDNNAPGGLPFICAAQRGAHRLPRNKGATLVSNMYQPQMTAFYGAGFVFSKCHAEKRVPIDPNSLWIFDGEEHSRSLLLWTAGYDMYAPTGKGLAIYHNYSAVAVRHFSLKVDPDQRSREETFGANRVKLHLGMEFSGQVNTSQLAKFSTRSKVRSLEQYYNFSGVPVNHDPWPNNTCYQLHWVPYEYAEDVEKLLPGWRLHAPEIRTRNITETRNVTVVEKVKCAENVEVFDIPQMASPLTASQGIQMIAFFFIIVILMTRRKRSSTRNEDSSIHSSFREQSSTNSLAR